MLGDREPVPILRLLLWRLHAERGESPSGNGVAYGGVACTSRRNTRSVRGDAMKAISLGCSRVHTRPLSLSLFYFGWRKFTSAEIKYSPRFVRTIPRIERRELSPGSRWKQKVDVRSEGNGDPLRHSIFSVPLLHRREPFVVSENPRSSGTRLDELDTREVLRHLAYPWL